MINPIFHGEIALRNQNMVPEYINTEKEVATKSINSLTQARNQILIKDHRTGTASSISMSDSGVCANPMYADGIWTLKSP